MSCRYYRNYFATNEQELGFRQMTHTPTTRYAVYMDRDEIVRVLRTFEAAGLEYVLIGAAQKAREKHSPLKK